MIIKDSRRAIPSGTYYVELDDDEFVAATIKKAHDYFPISKLTIHEGWSEFCRKMDDKLEKQNTFEFRDSATYLNVST